MLDKIFCIVEYVKWSLFVMLFFAGCSNEKPPNQDSKISLQRFSLLPSEQTQILFENKLIEGPNTNVLMYEYFYNGGGVSTADFNGDGKEDLYFTSNMGSNAMYLNEGAMRFREVTDVSKTNGRSGPWKTGTAVVDINGDGLLDIYLCYSGALPAQKRKNQLFVNTGNDENGIPVFKEEAEKFGLASDAFSNQAYFFDYDLDGDLDMLLLNHNPKSLPILNEVKTKVLLAEDDQQKGLRLFNQSDGFFSDVTQDAGINGSSLSYGLGIGISDLNNDGWPDFYVSNDYAVGDFLYINKKDGTFVDSLKVSMGHTSQFSMGNDISDINNDGFQDVFTLDMLPEDNKRQKLLLAPDNYEKFNLNIRNGFHYQYMRNMLQMNNGNGTYSEIGQFYGISNTDWSWSALFGDYDNDGWKDLYVTNGYLKDYTNLDFINYMDNYVQSKGKLLRTDVLEIIKKMPATQLSNYMFSNQNGTRFEDQTTDWGLKYTSNSNGAVYVDLDNDGDQDLVTNNINQLAFIFQNETNRFDPNNYLKVKLVGKGLNTLGIGAKVMVYCQESRQASEQFLSRGYLSSVSPILHFGVGKVTTIDSLKVIWPGGNMQLIEQVKPNQEVVLYEKDAEKQEKSVDKPNPVFTVAKIAIQHSQKTTKVNDFKRQPLLINSYSNAGACMAKGDFNLDGREDVFIGGKRGHSAEIYFQLHNGAFVQKKTNDFEFHKGSVDADVAIQDFDNDGDLDIFVASGGYHDLSPSDILLQDRLYFNDGKGNFTFRQEALPEYKVSAGCVSAHDVNNDGFIDLFIGGRLVPGQFPESPRSLLLINDGNGKFMDQTDVMAPELNSLGMITDASWVDISGDTTKELLIVGEWMPITVFGREQGKFINKTNDFFDKEYAGWWNKLALEDFNNDGFTDLVVGNFGTNTQFHPTQNQPAELHFKDFDNNGAVDPIFSFYIQGKSFPYLTRDELLNQIPNLKQKFTTYESYSSASLNEIWTKDEQSTAKYKSISHIETTLFLGTKEGKFTPAPLPQEVQYAPVYTINSLDFNQDGNKDLLLCGNSSYTKLRLGKLDANYGLLLEGDGEGNFSYVPQRLTGLKLSGNIRDVLQINDIILFGFSEKPLEAYRLVNKTIP